MNRRSTRQTPSAVTVVALSAMGILLAFFLMSLSSITSRPLGAQNSALGAPGDVSLATWPGQDSAQDTAAEPVVVTPLPAQNSALDVAAAPAVFTPPPVDEAFEVGNDLTIAALRTMNIEGSEITFEQTLANGANYSQYIASYVSEGNRIYGLLTVPMGDVPPGGFKAIVFNHGYIPPQSYRTTERYIAYVDTLARSGFVVFKIDMRGHGSSEGESSSSYFSPGYTIDAITALKSLQTLSFVDPQGIGMWGHSMSGNLVLRAMLVEPDIKAGVIWGGAVYSYADYSTYRISDSSFRPPPSDETPTPSRRRGSQLREAYGEPGSDHPYWRAISLTENIRYLQSPLQLHHAVNDSTVNVGYSRDLSNVLMANNRVYETYEYEGGEHNIESPYFETAMARTVEFFRKYL